MTTPRYADDADKGVEVRISPVLEREYKRRNVFPTLRLEHALRIVNGATGVYTVALDEAQRLLDDARSMQLDRELPRGTPLAYSCLARNLATVLKQAERRGLWNDPGIDEMRRRMAESPVQFNVGDECLFFHGESDDEYGHKVKIIGTFGLYFVSCKDGQFIKADGARGEYRRGYCVTFEGDPATYVVRAGQLTRDDCLPSHLCVVAGTAIDHATCDLRSAG